jgi:hypothetical protein
LNFETVNDGVFLLESVETPLVNKFTDISENILSDFAVTELTQLYSNNIIDSVNLGLVLDGSTFIYTANDINIASLETVELPFICQFNEMNQSMTSISSVEQLNQLFSGDIGDQITYSFTVLESQRLFAMLSDYSGKTLSELGTKTLADLTYITI